MSKTQKKSVIDLNEIPSRIKLAGQLLELHGENPFKVRAFSNGARVLKGLTDTPLDEMLQSGELLKVKGIGKGLAAEIEELIEYGQSSMLEELLGKTPEGLIEVMGLSGLGPKKVAVLWNELGIKSLGELEYACRENRLVTLKGFGDKSQKAILESVLFKSKNRNQLRIDKARILGLDIISSLKSLKDLNGNLYLSGEASRYSNTVSELSVLIAGKNNVETLAGKITKNLSKDFSELIHSPPKKETGWIESEKLILTSKGNDFPNLNFHFVSTKNEILGEIYHSSDTAHLNALNQILKSKKLNPEKEKLTSSEQFYSALDLEIIPNELREGDESIEWAKEGSIKKLVRKENLKGTYHIHTDFSDGTHDLETMVKKAEKFGFEFIGISDHSKTAVYAGGLKENAITKQHKEIDELNASKKYKVKILKGIESDILKDGSLDYPASTLKKFDFVIGSIHSSMRLSKADQTKRLEKAIDNPYLTMIGHLTGRLLLAREGVEVDMDKIIKKAAKNKKAIEINASPYRLDLDWKWGSKFRKLGGKTSINPDAHHYDEYENMEYGLMVARKSGFKASETLNENLNNLRKK